MMAYGEFYVEHQGWARWPKTLIMCRKRGYEIIERRRYVQERTCRIEHVKGGAMYDVWRCSACGYEYAESVSETSIVQNYCPNCGARVIGTEAGE